VAGVFDFYECERFDKNWECCGYKTAWSLLVACWWVRSGRLCFFLRFWCSVIRCTPVTLLYKFVSCDLLRAGTSGLFCDKPRDRQSSQSPPPHLYIITMSYAPQPDASSTSNTSAPSYIAPYPPQPYQPYPPAASGSGGGEPTSTRRADELARKDRTLAEFMLMLDEYDPLVSGLVSLCLGLGTGGG
jgi:hypothetical protein